MSAALHLNSLSLSLSVRGPGPGSGPGLSPVQSDVAAVEQFSLLHFVHWCLAVAATATCSKQRRREKCPDC